MGTVVRSLNPNRQVVKERGTEEGGVRYREDPLRLRHQITNKLLAAAACGGLRPNRPET